MISVTGSFEILYLRKLASVGSVASFLVERTSNKAFLLCPDLDKVACVYNDEQTLHLKNFH